MAEPSNFQIYATLPIQIAAQIGRAIVQGEFEPGRRLREVDLAQSFGVSRASVREALRLVESEGLITILPQRGAQVTALSAEELQDIFDIRAVLMGLISRRLAEKVSPDLAKRLGEYLKALRAARDDGDAYAQTSLELSDYCVQQAGRKRLAEVIHSFNRRVARYSRLGLANPERRKRSYAKWSEMIAAIIDGKTDEAERLTRQQVAGNRDAIMQVLTSEKAP